MIRASVASASAVTSSPPTTRLSLLARATSMPSVSATIVGPSPAEPTMPLRTRSAPEVGDQLADPLLAGQHAAVPGRRGLPRPRPDRRARRRAPRDRAPARPGAPSSEPAASPTTASSSEPETTSSACSPIEPVAPRITSFFIPTQCRDDGSGRLKAARPGYPRPMSAPSSPSGPTWRPSIPCEDAAALGADCVQVFLSDPQGWKKPPPRADAEELRGSECPLYVHAPYLINVCSPKNNIRYGSRKILQQTCEAAAEVEAAAVIVHPGHAEDGIEAARPLGADARDARERGPALHREHRRRRQRRRAALRRPGPPLGGGVRAPKTDVEVGFCFDTCHAHAAGEELSDAVERVLAIVGPDRPPARKRLARSAGTGADRHANLGKGEIGRRRAAGDDPRRERAGGLRDARQPPTTCARTSSSCARRCVAARPQ